MERPGAVEADGSKARRKSARYPGAPLSKCEDASKVLFAEGARNVLLSSLAEALGNNSTTSGSFLTLRAALNYFGLASSEGEHISLTPETIEALHSEDEDALRRLRVEAVLRPPLYKKLLDRYIGKQLPPDEVVDRKSVV